MSEYAISFSIEISAISFPNPVPRTIPISGLVIPFDFKKLIVSFNCCFFIATKFIYLH